MVVPTPNAAATQVDSDVRVITEPAVYVLGRQTIDDAELDRFLADHGVSWESDSEVAGEVITETAGRVCYMSFAKPRPGGHAAYLTHIKEVGHGSVLEHAVWSFLITGVSRSLTHELVRHRAGWAYSQLSQRYVDESVAEFVMPPAIIGDEALESAWRTQVESAQRSYVTLVDELMQRYSWVADKVHRRKMAREAARAVLPNATETKIVATGNVRAWRTMLELRSSEGAEMEIRRFAIMALRLMQTEAPGMFSDFEIYIAEDRKEAARLGYHKI